MIVDNTPHCWSILQCGLVLLLSDFNNVCLDVNQNNEVSVVTSCLEWWTQSERTNSDVRARW